MSTDVSYAQLAILKSNLKMNKIGMKHSAQKGRAIRPMCAEQLGLKPTDSYDTFIAEVQKRMDRILSDMGKQ